MDRDVVIVAGGIGLAPLRPVIDELLRSPVRFGSALLAYGARTPQDRLYTAELDAWRGAGLEVAGIFRAGELGDPGRIRSCDPLLRRQGDVRKPAHA